MTWPTKTDFVDGDVLTAAQVNNIGTNLNLFNPTSATVGQVWTADGAGSGSFATPSGGGFDIMTPSAVSAASGTVTINGDGSVTLSSATQPIKFEGVFSAAYENYMIVIELDTSAYGSAAGISMGYLQGSTFLSTGHYSQYIRAVNTTVSAGRTSNSSFNAISYFSAGDVGGITVFVTKPYQTARTIADAIGGTDEVFQSMSSVYSTTASIDGWGFTSNWVMDGTVTTYGLVTT